MFLGSIENPGRGNVQAPSSQWCAVFVRLQDQSRVITANCSRCSRPCRSFQHKNSSASPRPGKCRGFPCDKLRHGWCHVVLICVRVTLSVPTPDAHRGVRTEECGRTSVRPAGERTATSVVLCGFLSSSGRSAHTYRAFRRTSPHPTGIHEQDRFMKMIGRAQLSAAILICNVLGSKRG